MHAGLWFERYFNAYQSDFTDIDNNQRADYLKAIARKQHGDTTRLKRQALRQRQLLISENGQARLMTCQGNFVTGLGNAHPLENGFTWHPTLGMPYLPGSSVKGLLRSLIETSYHGADKTEVLTLWFGSASKEPDDNQQAGALIFLDALPVQACDLHVEVMTPHQGDWYAKCAQQPHAGKAQPGDWHNPVPVTYLVARNLTLQFAVLPRPGAPQVDFNHVWQALEHALAWLGAGAKTAIGFGQFAANPSAEAKLGEEAQQAHAQQQQNAQMAAASPHEKLILELEQAINQLPEGLSPSDQRFSDVMALIEQTVATMLAEGSPSDRLSCQQTVPRCLQARRLSPSKKREKAFKQLLNSLSEGTH